jgi:hypothetical protein
MFVILSVIFIGCGNKGAAVKSGISDATGGVYKSDKRVLFVFTPNRSDIENVQIVGDFVSADMKPIDMEYKDGAWRIALELDYGIYQYRYLINNEELIPDPNAEAYAPDSQGGRVSIVEITAGISD